jgi:nitrite reductase/ring-hydroxylating ferredoxin subunit/uncharacterized membrane protein
MRSSAQVRGHPIHVMLIPFPLAFLVGSFAADAAGVALGRPALWSVGWHLAIAGVAMGLLAAVPGLIDYLRTVPPESSARTRATRHMIVNLGAVTLFAIAWLLRGDAGTPPGAPVLAMGGAGAVLLTVGGWLGGTLVHRNQIGIDHRYARAGKWREARVGPAGGTPLVVASAGELQVDQMKLVRVGSRRIVLARTEEGYVAFDDRCTHRGGSLAGGAMVCGTVQCPWHGSQFDVRTGAVRAGPAGEAIRTHRVEESDGRVILFA